MDQPALPLEEPDLAPLREAFHALPERLRRRITFEQAMSCKALAIALRLHAEAIKRARAHATPH